MPSLQDALQAALDKKQASALQETITEWSQDDPQPQPKQEKQMQAHPGVSRSVFQYVVDHPHHTRKQLRQALQKEGLSDNSVSSLITQYVRAGYFKEVDSRLTTEFTSYVPVPTKKQLATIRARDKRKMRLQARQERAVPAIVKEVTLPPVQSSAQQLLDTLPIKQARELYDELHKIFGGVK